MSATLLNRVSELEREVRELKSLTAEMKALLSVAGYCVSSIPQKEPLPPRRETLKLAK